MELIAQKPYAQISVSELCRLAGISRQTFYSLFSSRENVVVFTLEERYCYAPPSPEVREGRESELQALCRGYSRYMVRNRSFLKLLAENGIDYLLYDSIVHALGGCGAFLSRVEPCTRSYAVSFYAGGLSRVARQYAREGCTATEEELARMLMALFTGELF